MKNKFRFSNLVIMLIFIMTASSFAYDKVSIPSVEQYIIRVQNIKNGQISVRKGERSSWEVLGLVIYPCKTVNRKGYTASKWAKPGAVAATAVNAIHIKTGDNVADDKGIVFSLVPKDMMNPPSYYNSFLSPDSSIYTNIKAGEGIFGGFFAPYIGNPVSYSKDNSSEAIQISGEYVPSIGDTIYIDVLRPLKYPKSIIFDNSFGGPIKIDYGGGEISTIGQVLKPVQGVGRFSGTQFSDLGRIRANHTGVIDISTSPIGLTGGFQIIPSKHGMSAEMGNARILTQWMVIGPLSVFSNDIEGLAPLFSSYLQPKYKAMDLDSETFVSDLLNRFVVDVKLKGSKDWQPMPVAYLDPDLNKKLPDWANSALKDITYVRILFPLEN